MAKNAPPKGSGLRIGILKNNASDSEMGSETQPLNGRHGAKSTSYS